MNLDTVQPINVICYINNYKKAGFYNSSNGKIPGYIFNDIQIWFYFYDIFYPGTLHNNAGLWPYIIIPYLNENKLLNLYYIFLPIILHIFNNIIS